MRSILAIGLLTASSPAFAASTVTVVTPVNVSDLPLQFRVETESYGNGMMRFDLFVFPGAADISPRREARFVVWGAGAEGPPDRGFGARPPAERPLTLAVSRVAGDPLEPGLRYEVQAHRSLLSRISLTFRNFDPGGQASFDGYEIMLGAFVTADD